MSGDLVWAAHDGDLERVKYELDNGADVDSADEDGSTPLIAASWNGHAEIVKLLLDHGANLEAANATYLWTPLVSAGARGHSKVVQLLVDRGANSLRVDKFTKTALDYAQENKPKPRGEGDSTITDEGESTETDAQRIARYDDTIRILTEAMESQRKQGYTPNTVSSPLTSEPPKISVPVSDGGKERFECQCTIM